jgi:heat shock protein HslJ
MLMLLFSAVHSYGHQLLRESLPFQDDIDIPSLVGMNWQLKEINGAVVLLKDPPGLIFSSDSSLGGSNGCQRFFGQWGTVPSSSMITVDIVGETRISCPRMTNEQKQQRRDFMGVLRQDKDAIAYSISEDEQELTLHVDDTPTMTLMRIPFAGSAAS